MKTIRPEQFPTFYGTCKVCGTSVDEVKPSEVDTWHDSIFISCPSCGNLIEFTDEHWTATDIRYAVIAIAILLALIFIIYLVSI